MSEKYFETIKCKDYEIFNLEYHKKRVSRTISINLNLEDYIYPPSDEFFRCKVIYDESGVLDVQYFPYKKREIKSFKVIVDDNIDYSKKYLDRSKLDELFSKKEEADEIIIIKNGFLTDTSIANIALFDGSNWFTPKKPLLVGTTRDRLLNESFLIEKDLTIEDLKSAKKIALMNTMIDFDEVKDYSLFL